MQNLQDAQLEKERIMNLITRHARPIYKNGLEITKVRLRMFGWDFEEYTISYQIDKTFNEEGKLTSRRVGEPIFNFTIEPTEDGSLIFKKTSSKSSRHTVVKTAFIANEIKVTRRMKYRQGKREKVFLCLDFDEHLYYTDGSSRYSPEEFESVEVQ